MVVALSPDMKKILFFLIILLFLGAVAQGQGTTDPVGFMEVTIAPGNGTTRALTILSFPLVNTTSVTGAKSGQIASVTSNTITDTAAGWAAGELSIAATPKIIRFTSGIAAGRTFLVSTATPNTSTVLTLDNSETADLTTLGIVSGDTYKIFDCQTLYSLFGTPATFAFLANVSADSSDNVLLPINGAWNTFYYSTTSNRWTKDTLGSPDATNQAVKPESAVLFNRLGGSNALSLIATGTVPTTRRSDTVRASGLTGLSNSWPTDITLLNSGIQSIPNWQANSNVNSADQVLLLVNGTWSTFWWTGTNWKKRTLGSPISDSQLIVAGTGIVLTKTTASSTDSQLTQNPPY